jgi:hypothetical protein
VRTKSSSDDLHQRVLCSSPMNGFWLPLWYLQTLLEYSTYCFPSFAFLQEMKRWFGAYFNLSHNLMKIIDLLYVVRCTGSCSIIRTSASTKYWPPSTIIRLCQRLLNFYQILTFFNKLRLCPIFYMSLKMPNG